MHITYIVTYDEQLSVKYQKTKKDTLSLYFSCGTGTPHLRSLVIQRVFSPSLSHAYVAWIAFWLQDPAIEVLFMYSSNWSFSSGSSRNKWSVSRVRGVAWHTCLQHNFCMKIVQMGIWLHNFKVSTQNINWVSWLVYLANGQNKLLVSLLFPFLDTGTFSVECLKFHR